MNPITIIESTILLVLVLFVLLRRWGSPDTCNDFHHLKNLNLKNLKNLKSGDILYTTFGHIGARTFSFLMNTRWCHTAVVYNDGSEVYVIEGVKYPFLPTNGGLLILPLSLWIEIRKNDAYIGYLPINKECNNVIRAYNHLRNVKLSQRSYEWWKYLIPSYLKKSRCPCTEDRLTCHEFTIAILQLSGVFSKSRQCSSYFPWDIPNIQTVNGFSYRL